MMDRTPFFLRYRLHHLLFWMLAFGVWYFLRVDDYSTTRKAFTVTLVKILDLALMIYITNYVLIPALLYKKRYGLFVLAFMALVVTSSIFKMNILGRYLDNPALYNWTGDLKKRIYDNIIPHFFLVIAGAAIKLMFDYGKLQRRMAEIAREKAEAELNFLKSQINPHFLFNSLNAVYFLIHKDNADARQALHRFSDMLRYQLYELKGDRVPIEKEIGFIKDYIYLQQLRKDEKYEVSFACGEEVKDFSIEPLLLIPFVENAFKHISNHTDRVNKVDIQLSRSNGVFLFKVENTKEPVPDHTNKNGGIGMANVKRRLELLYPGKHELAIREQPDRYTVDFRLKL